MRKGTCDASRRGQSCGQCGGLIGISSRANHVGPGIGGKICAVKEEVRVDDAIRVRHASDDGGGTAVGDEVDAAARADGAQRGKGQSRRAAGTSGNHDRARTSGRRQSTDGFSARIGSIAEILEGATSGVREDIRVKDDRTSVGKHIA